MMGSLSGKVVVITGANSGIGKATALALARLGTTTVLACRNEERAEAARKEIQKASANDAVLAVHLDLADLGSIDTCAGQLLRETPHIDVLVNNAGGMWTSRQLTPDGFEQTFATNYLGHYALTRLILHSLRHDPPARVINVSSEGHHFVRGMHWHDLGFERGWSPIRAYAQSKLAQLLFTLELAGRCGGSGTVSHAVHPGFVHSNFFSSDGSLTKKAADMVARRFAVPPEKGAETSVYVATSEEAGSENGRYWASSKAKRPSRAARDYDASRRLWVASERLVSDAGLTLPAH